MKRKNGAGCSQTASNFMHSLPRARMRTRKGVRAPPCAGRALVLEFIASPFSPSSVRRQARLPSVGKPVSSP